MKLFKHLILFALELVLLDSCQEDKKQNLIIFGFVGWKKNISLADFTKSLLEDPENAQHNFEGAEKWIAGRQETVQQWFPPNSINLIKSAQLKI